MIADISKHQGKIDWDKLAPVLDFVVIKASGLYENNGDPMYAANVAGAVAHGVPFHVFHFLYCQTEADARRDAGLFYRMVKDQGHDPLFWVLDCEAGWGIANNRARPVAEAFESELRRLAGKDIRVALYVAQEKYYAYALDYDHYAYVWIPGYGEKYKPKMPCDVWQYTSSGSLPGISGRVDLDVLMGTKPMSYFKTGKMPDGGEKMFTGKLLAAFCEKVFKAEWAYWYGTYGRRCTQSLYESKKAQYPSHYTSDRASGYKADIAEGRTCADCVGMIKAFFWCGGVFGAEPKYASNNCPDKSANGMFALCTETGAISTIPDIPGLAVWKSGHIGVYVGGGYVVEMKGFAQDCLRRKVSAGGWSKWGKLPPSMLSYEDEPVTPEPAEPEGDRALRNGDKGADVKQLQTDLIRLGYSCGKWGTDGDFGDATEAALEAFQRDNELPATGIYDGATREALEAALDALDEQPVELPDASSVEIVGGNCYVRSAPNTGGKKLGVVYEGEILPYQGQTSADGWHLVEYKSQNGWVSGKYSRLIDAGGAITRGKKICDISKYQPTINYEAFIRDTALIIMRAGYRKSDGKVYEDECFERHADALTARGVRFGVYFYSWADTEDKAREEARMFYKYAKGKKPLFWAMDAEKDVITTGAIMAFIDELRKLGAAKVGCYVANHLYQKYDYASIRDKMDFTWIPRYSDKKPVYRCDLWQYTSSGTVSGINGNVDLNRITGEGHDLEWFTKG